MMSSIGSATSSPPADCRQMVISTVGPVNGCRHATYNRPRMTSRFRGGEIYGIPITTRFDENNAIRCAGCGEVINGTPFRVTLLDIVSPEVPPSWAVGAPLNPGPHEFH